jgi:putative spermidine/putrescine transport system permease protein
VTGGAAGAPPAADPRTLRGQVRRAGRRQQARMLALLAPTVLFLGVFFVAPVGLFLFRSVDNAEVPGWLPRTVGALGAWDGAGHPPEAVHRALAQDLRALAGTTALPLLGRRLNHAIPGFRGLVIGTANRVDPDRPGSAREQLAAIDPRWDDPAYWQAIRRERHRLTPFYLLSALDLRQRADGGVERVPEDSALFLDLFGRTLRISAAVTLLCLLIGFPVAATMAGSSPAVANTLLLLVLVPFWTSLLVRSAAWVILLQNRGLVNQALLGLGLLDRPAPLIFNRLGLYVAMVHVLLPFMILPLYSVLRGIPRELMRAAASLGAGPVVAFRRVYVPQALPGLVAGASLVFVLALGYYITPALVGGPGDQMIGYFIAYFTNTAVNWGMAAALGTILLAMVALIYLALGRAVGFQRLAIR